MIRNTFPFIPNEIKLYDESYMSEFLPFLKNKRIILDIGCGHGDFLIENTMKHNDYFFIGIEISRKRVYKTSSRLAKRNIANYAVVDSDGETALKLLFTRGSVDEIHINFPDPWLRKRQWKNRLFKPSFLIQAVRVLKKNGILNFVTDVEEYANEVCSILTDFPFLKNNYSSLIEKNIYSEFPTLFYKKMSPLREICYLSFKKI